MEESKIDSPFKKIWKVLFKIFTSKVFIFIFDTIILTLMASSIALLVFELKGETFSKLLILEIACFTLGGLLIIQWLMHLSCFFFIYSDSRLRKIAIRKWIFSFSSVLTFIFLLMLLLTIIPNDSNFRYFKCLKLVVLLKICDYLYFIPYLCNYHSHTTRCGHARGEDIEYVYASIFNKYKELGFSDHVPFKNRTQIGIRQDFKVINDYCDSVNNLKKAFKHSLKIYLGYEAEYYEEYDDYYKQLFDKYHLDYLILGQHCRLKGKDGFEFYMARDYKDNYDNLKEYVDSVIKGIESGYFLYVAHPDIIMNCFTNHLDERLLEEMKRIISASVKYDCPLEINLGGAALKCNPPKYNYLNEPFIDSYPYEEFFSLVGKMGAKVVIGVDAHSPFHYQINERKYAYALVKKYKLNLVKKLEIKRREYGK